jgi:hypothetical protein
LQEKIRFWRRDHFQIEAARDSNRFSNRSFCPASVQKWFSPSHFGTTPPEISL